MVIGILISQNVQQIVKNTEFTDPSFEEIQLPSARISNKFSMGTSTIDPVHNVRNILQ